ncbi:MAG: trypsin-like peptidase domain-containing protein [Chloroflexia bacterium]|nr:trypsin-like peptidase domain-containing protein [Chloroflexia bacterium]
MANHHPSSDPSGVMATLKRSGIAYLAAMAVVLAVAFGTFYFSDADAGIATGQPPYTVSLVSQSANQETATGLALSVADVAETANNAVVTVYTFVEGGGFNGEFPELVPAQESPEEWPSGEPAPLGAGSGWIFSEDGYVVTNAHVVGGADSFVVQYHDGTQVEAELIGTDVFQDIAILKLVLDDGATVPGVAVIGDSAALRPGDEVVAIGSPLGEFTNSVSDGHIGGLDRSLEVGNGISLDNLIQHDAEISPGNSGGPLLNMRGEVIGMNVAKVETAAANGPAVSGLNFAIDGNTVAEIAESIIANNGSIAVPYLGVQTQLTDEGTVVLGVEPGGPADGAGIVAGDVIASIDGAAVDDDTSVMRLLLEQEPDDTVSIGVQRDGTHVEVEVTLGARPEGI